MKRFYTRVHVERAASGHQVFLDGRPLKTQGGRQQVVDSLALCRLLQTPEVSLDLFRLVLCPLAVVHNPLGNVSEPVPLSTPPPSAHRTCIRAHLCDLLVR